MKGTYCLIIEVPVQMNIATTALSKLEFKKGYWLYIGSAQGSGSTNLANRLKRHFRDDKKIHWHIDHLLDSKANIVDAVWAESTSEFECRIAQNLEGKSEFIWGPKGFGNSDCTKSCKSHILFFHGRGHPQKHVEIAFLELGLAPERYSKLEPTTQ